MPIEVRFVPTDLTPGEVVTYDDASSYAVLDDNTLVLLDEEDENHAVIHPQRWASARVVAAK